jgi:WD40 repeat protein
MAFNWDTLGSSLAVLPLTASGRPDKASIPRIDGHSDTVTDFAFSPFDDSLLASGSSDQTVKLWRIPASGPYSNITRPELVLPEQPRKVNFSKNQLRAQFVWLRNTVASRR